MPGALAILGAALGFTKSVLGLAVRPTAGFIESGSKVMQVRGAGGCLSPVCFAQ